MKMPTLAGVHRITVVVTRQMLRQLRKVRTVGYQRPVIVSERDRPGPRDHHQHESRHHRSYLPKATNSLGWLDERYHGESSDLGTVQK